MLITELKDNQCFVFGSNLNGHHLGGAAKLAYEDFGAIWGNGWGSQGVGHDFKSYAIPTLGFQMEKLSLEEIKRHLDDLVMVAEWCPEKEFLLTPIGTGIAGNTLDEIKSILPKLPYNIIKIGKWE